MKENGRELVEQVHREAIQRYQEEEKKGREAVEAMFRAALEHELERESR